MSSRQETRQKVFERKLQQAYEDIKTMTDRAGFVYVAVHDAWPNFSKIGCTKDPIQRIKTYSTYDPVDCYKLVAYKLVEDMWEYEKFIHTFLKDFRLNSEWFNLRWTTSAGIIHEEDIKQKKHILRKALEASKNGTYSELKHLPAQRKMNVLDRHHKHSAKSV